MRTRLGLFLAITILGATLVGGFLGDRVNAGAPLEDDSQRILKTFTEALATIQSNYATEVTSEELVESAIRGMLRTLDPHSSFFSRRDYNRLQEEQQGKYHGLGITIRPEAPGSGRVVVVEPPAPGTPAYKAGLRAGDVIAKIEGTPIDDWEVNEEVIPNLKGPKGTTVNITVERPGEPESIEFEVERDEIPLYTIKYAFLIEPQIGYIKIDRFAETTSRELDKALSKLGEQELEGLVLDLRDNPGGALSQAIEVSDRFLQKSEVIVSTRSREGREREYTAPRGERFEYPMVVLINENSASASEIVAGALQDHDRALIVGKTSFGKALVQTIYPLEQNRGLALTTGKYYTPSDRLIQRDYSSSFWDYYNSREERADVSQRDKFMTDAGRIVYGGGGIMPDKVIEQVQLDRTVRKVQRGNLLREFAGKMYSGEIESAIRTEFRRQKLDQLKPLERREQVDDLDISDETMNQFQEFIREDGISIGEEEFAENKDVLRNLLRQELFMLLFGDEESYRVRLDLDRQVRVAIETLPRVTSLLSKQMTAAEEQPSRADN